MLKSSWAAVVGQPRAEETLTDAHALPIAASEQAGSAASPPAPPPPTDKAARRARLLGEALKSRVSATTGVCPLLSLY